MMNNNFYLPMFLGENGPAPKPLIPGGSGVVGGDPESPMAKEMRSGYKNVLPYDNKPAYEVARSAATKAGINPRLLFSSAWQEGLNKAASQPEREKIDKYVKDNKMDVSGFPVNGYQYYGLDTFGDKAQSLIEKGYLPKDFAFAKVPMWNDHTKTVNGKKVADPQPVTAGSFRTHEEALMAKAAMMRDTSDKVQELAKKKGITLDEDASNYFTLVGYNAGEGNADKMLDDFAKAKDKKAFLQNGGANWQKVHKNIAPRIQNMKVAQELLAQDK